MTDQSRLGPLHRRDFLSKLWKLGGGLIAAAGAWTSWDLLQPLPASGFGGKIRTLIPDAITEGAVVEVPAARAYLTRVNGELYAFSEKCTHLGCRVPYCDSSGQFECPCHGTNYSRGGDLVAGPAPRGMDRYPTEIGSDGLVYIDTGAKQDGPAPGSKLVDEPARGPACAAEGH